MDKELQKIFPDWGKDGRRYPDKLLKVFMKNGMLEFVLIHVEVEGKGKKGFSRRMFEYFLRLWDKYPKANITVIAIYIGENVPVDYDVFRYEFAGTKIRFDFNAYVVKDQSEEQLLKSKNPFAKVVLACWYILKSKKDYALRLHFKIKLIRLCFESGFSQQEIRELFIFVGFTIALPSQQDAFYKTEIKHLIEKKMKPLAEVNPLMAETVEMLIWGKTAKERDAERDAERNKEIVVRLYKGGISQEQIIKIIGFKKKFVEETIKGIAKKNGKKANGKKKPPSKKS